MNPSQITILSVVVASTGRARAKDVQTFTILVATFGDKVALDMGCTVRRELISVQLFAYYPGVQASGFRPAGAVHTQVELFFSISFNDLGRTGYCNVHVCHCGHPDGIILLRNPGFSSTPSEYPQVFGVLYAV